MSTYKLKVPAERLIKYPDIRTDTVTDNYFGTPIADPYRWLENIQSEEVKKFVKAQNQLTDEYLKKSSLRTDDASGDGGDSQIRERIRKRLIDLWSYCDYGCPFKRGDHYFYFKDGALYMLFATCNIEHNDSEEYGQSMEEEGDVVLDPNSVADGFVCNLSKGTFTGLSISSKDKTDENFGDRMISISNDGNILAYGLSENGSVWCTIHFKNLRTLERYETEVLNNVRQDTYLSWKKDGEGLFYGRYPEKTLSYKNEKIFYHRMGTPQSEDKLIFEFLEHPDWELKPKVSFCGNYLIIYVLKDCGGHTKVYLARMDSVMSYIKGISKTKKLPTFIQLVKDFQWNYDYITNEDSTFYFITNKSAPNSKIVKVDVSNTKEIAESAWPTVVNHDRKNVLDWATCVNQQYLITCYIKNVRSCLQLRKLRDGSILYTFPLELGTVTGHCGRPQDHIFFFKFSSFLSPGTVYLVNLEYIDMAKTEALERHQRIACWCPCRFKPTFKLKIPLVTFKRDDTKCFISEKYEVNQIYYTSRDGTKIPMYLVYKKGLVNDGKNPCLLNAYGGFNASVQPYFDPMNIAFVELFNGIYALANIRGGGEFGVKWYKAGIRLNKQNSFDDFQCAAKYLSRSKYTSPEKLAILGSSNGGLVVAASINQKPELFGAAIAAFGVFDLLRFHKFSSGSCWISDYGSSENEVDFKNLYYISPVHNVKPPKRANVQYPATLLITAENDQIVLPLHSYKMIAKLQSVIGSSQKQQKPFLLRVEKNTGHGRGAMAFETAIDETVDILAFLKFSLDFPLK